MKKEKKPISSFHCRLCKRTAIQVGGYLERVNEKGVIGIWECRPSCGVKLTQEEALISAIKG